MDQTYKGMLSIDRTDIDRDRKREERNAAESTFEAAFERLMEHTDLRRCMDALGRVLERYEDACEGNKISASAWHDRAEMLFDLGEQFQGMD